MLLFPNSIEMLNTNVFGLLSIIVEQHHAVVCLEHHRSLWELSPSCSTESGRGGGCMNVVVEGGHSPLTPANSTDCCASVIADLRVSPFSSDNFC